MSRAPFVSALTIVAFISAGTVRPASAAASDDTAIRPTTTAGAASPLGSSIDRAAASAAQFPRVADRRPAPARKAQQGGGGGGGGMMIMSLVSTLAALAGTYYLVKEMQKQAAEARNQQ